MSKRTRCVYVMIIISIIIIHGLHVLVVIIVIIIIVEIIVILCLRKRIPAIDCAIIVSMKVLVYLRIIKRCLIVIEA